MRPTGLGRVVAGVATPLRGVLPPGVATVAANSSGLSASLRDVLSRHGILLTFLATIAFVSTARADDKPRLVDLCHCTSNNIPCHGTARWKMKTETNQAPHTGVSKRTPTQIAHWPDLAPDPVTHTYRQDAPRVGNELKWFEVTGLVTLIRAEDDGDLHIQMQDAKGTNASVNLVVEVPAGDTWCGARANVFKLLKNPPPFNATGNELALVRTDAVIKVVGRAFFDGQHASDKYGSNLRKPEAGKPRVAVWEIHPVADLHVVK